MQKILRVYYLSSLGVIKIPVVQMAGWLKNKLQSGPSVYCDWAIDEKSARLSSVPVVDWVKAKLRRHVANVKRKSFEMPSCVSYSNWAFDEKCHQFSCVS
jgi:hypothetical protein